MRIPRFPNWPPPPGALKARATPKLSLEAGVTNGSGAEISLTSPLFHYGSGLLLKPACEEREALEQAVIDAVRGVSVLKE